MSRSPEKIRLVFGMFLLSAIALCIHGYHPYAEDAEIYMPGILKILNPALFPTNTQFFGEHAGHSLYPNLIAASIRVSHLPLVWIALIWQIVSIVLLLAAAWRLASALFENELARWGSVCLMAALLTIPVAGTALYILDQYLNPRNLAAFGVLFAIAEISHRCNVRALLWLAFAAAMHPFMASFGIMFCAWMVILRRYQPKLLGFGASEQPVPATAVSAGLMLPFGITLDPPPPAYHAVAASRPFHYLFRWQWYEWLGLIGPVVLFWWLGRYGQRRGMTNLELISRAMVPFVTIAAIAAAILSGPSRFEALARLQPLRCLALTYMVLIVIGGGWLAEHVLQDRAWQWLLLFVPLALGMFVAQRQLFPMSQHIEWPGSQPRNLWAQAFDWIRENTPTNAFFAIDPAYMNVPGEDTNGFRARAQRSRLADDDKDEGAASMFPPLAVSWAAQSQDQRNWRHFTKADLQRLRGKYGISWVVVEQPDIPELDCPYANAAVRVCHVPGA